MLIAEVHACIQHVHGLSFDVRPVSAGLTMTDVMATVAATTAATNSTAVS